MNIQNLKDILKKEYGENEVLEIKENNSDPERIAKYISALSNEATMNNLPEAYMIWGINDESLELVGTNFVPEQKRKGNENLVGWLERSISPQIQIKFEHLSSDNKEFVILIIAAAEKQPTRYNNYAYIRSGSSLKPLNYFPEKQTKLWQKLNSNSFELSTALHVDSIEELSNLLNVEKYCQLLNIPVIDNNELLVKYFLQNKIIKHENMGYSITNLGALTLARRLSDFPTIENKGVRIICYDSDNKVGNALSDYSGQKGYAVGFEGIIKYVLNHLPKREEINESGKRIKKTDFEMIEIRELVANVLVHQDLSISGSRPTIEIYNSRIEFINPGNPIIDVDRLLDMPPKSRNENLANLFHLLGFVEQRGSGIDRVVESVEKKALPAPEIINKSENMIVTLFGKKDFNELDNDEKVASIYLHACLLYTGRSYLTNKSLRTRFDLPDSKSSQISKAITLAIKANKIKPFDPDAGAKFMKYIPYWA